MGIHFLCYAHGNERIGTYNAIHDTFVTIMWVVGFHVGQEQLHAFLPTTFNSSCQRINIMLTKDDICTLTDIVIADRTQADLLPQSYTTQGFVAFDVTQAKEKSYGN